MDQTTTCQAGSADRAWIAAPKAAAMARTNTLVAMATGNTHQDWEKVSMAYRGVNVRSIGFFMI